MGRTNANPQNLPLLRRGGVLPRPAGRTRKNERTPANPQNVCRGRCPHRPGNTQLQICAHHRRKCKTSCRGGRPCPPVGYDHFRHRVSIKPERLPRGSMWASTSTDGLRFRIGVYGFAGLCRRAGQAPPLRYDETRYSSKIRTLLLISPLRGQLPLKGKPWCGAKPTHVQIHYYLYKTPGQASPAPEDVLAPGRGCRGLFLAAGIAAAAGRSAAAAGARADAAAGAAAVAAAAVTAAAAGRAGRRIRRGGADPGDGGGRARSRAAAAAAAGIAAGLPDKIRENDPAVHATGITHSGKPPKKDVTELDAP